MSFIGAVPSADNSKVYCTSVKCPLLGQSHPLTTLKSIVHLWNVLLWGQSLPLTTLRSTVKCPFMGSVPSDDNSKVYCTRMKCPFMETVPSADNSKVYWTSVKCPFIGTVLSADNSVVFCILYIREMSFNGAVLSADNTHKYRSISLYKSVLFEI